MNESPTRAAELALAVGTDLTAKTVVSNAAGGAGAGVGEVVSGVPDSALGTSQLSVANNVNVQSDEPDISLKDFLNLLHHVYQLADNSIPPPPSHESGCEVGPMGHGPDWSRLADDPILYHLFDCASQRDGEPDASADVIAMLMNRLTDFLQEGILDAVLPYVVPRVTDNFPETSLTGHQRPPAVPTIQTPQGKSDGRRRSRTSTTTTTTQQDNGKPDFEVEIHVCDEVKNAKKDFRCPQKLLVSKMGYFAEVTVGQKLEDMDISVHCDLAIFDWLMRWVKKDLLPRDAAPTLDVSNAVPILVSAAFLQMDPLLDDCLQFCQANLNAILRSSTNLGCLNDNILSRLASLCSNTEVDSLKDKKDRIQSRLFCKLISSLAEPRPDNKRGHYASLSAVFRCQRCKQLVPMYNTCSTDHASVPCRPDCSRLDGKDGKVYGMHVRDSSWNVTDYVREIRAETQSWRRTYWRLWADCHFQVCSLCGHLFSTRLRRFCRYHIQPPQFFGVNGQRGATHSIGRYSCCGQRAFRFEPIDSQSGCSFRSHQPLMRSAADEEIEKIVQAHNSLICCDPPSEAPSPVATASGVVSTSGDAGARKDHIWWEGLEFAPPRGRHGLLGRMWESYRRKAFRAAGPQGPSEEAESAKASCIPPAPTVSENPGLTAAASSHSIDIDSSPSTSSSEDNQESASTASSDEEESAPVKAKTSSRPSVGGSRRRRGFGRRGSLAAFSIRTGKDPSPLVAPPDSMFHWSEKVSTRTNQDNQREYEERAIRFMVSLLTRRTSAHHPCQQTRRHGGHHGGRHYSIYSHTHCCRHSSRSSHHLSTLAGGSYLRIEAAWREEQAATNAIIPSTVVGASAGSRLHQNATSRPRSKAGR